MDTVLQAPPRHQPVSRVPALRNPTLRMPPPPQFDSIDIPVGAKTPNFLCITCLWWHKDVPSPPIITQIPPKLQFRHLPPRCPRAFQSCAIEVYPLVLSGSNDALVVRQAHHERDVWGLYLRPAPATLPPCSNPSPIRTILPSAPIPTRHPGPPQPTQRPLPNTANLPPPNPLICPPIPLKPPPKPFPRPPFSPTTRPMPYWN